MAQLSTDSLVYAQIIAMVNTFVTDYALLKNVSPEKFDESYQKLLAEIQSKIGGTTFDITLLQKGDIPSSEVFNKIISRLTTDLNIVTNQLDSMSANYVNTFNIFSNQIEAEKKSISRIRSKINILEMYSQSPFVDTSYIGDSFADLSKLDSSKVEIGLIPDVSDGYMCLPKTSFKRINSSVRVINENYNNSIKSQVSFADTSNGLKGNHFLFNKDLEDSPFIYEKSSASLRSNESAINDDSPITFFEYEALSIDPAAKGDKPLYEFQYFNGNTLIDWSDFDVSNPLKLTLEFSILNDSGDYMNYLSITPFFGDDSSGNSGLSSNIFVSSIKLYNKDTNQTLEVIKGNPVCIGSDISQKNIDNYTNFYADRAVFKFDQVKVHKIYVTFQQPLFKDVVIKHAYWTPYELGKNTRWNNQWRFDPESIVDTINKNPSWDKKLLVPNISRPTEFKTGTPRSKQISVSYNEEISSQAKWQLRLQAPKNSAPNSAVAQVMEDYFWYKKDNNFNVDLFVSKEYANAYADYEGMDSVRRRLINFASNAPCIFVDPTDANYLSKSKINLQTVEVSSSTATITTDVNHGLLQNDFVYIKGSSGSFGLFGIYKIDSVPSGKKFSFSVSSPTTLSEKDISTDFFICFKTINFVNSDNLNIFNFVEKVSKSTSKQIVVERNFDEIKAKRASIGIRDISFGKEIYQNRAQMVSKPFLLNGNLDLLSLYASDFIPNSQESSIEYSVSVDGGNIFFPIQPVERNYTGVPEILAFNQNLSNNDAIPQVTYLDNGKNEGVPNPVNSIIVKIDIKKSRSTNSTPVVYYYKLGTRYR